MQFRWEIFKIRIILKHRVDLKNTVNSRYLEVMGTIFYKFKIPELIIWTCKNSSNAKLWLEKAIKIYVFFIQRDVSSFAEFEISEFDISRVDCSFMVFPLAYADSV